MKPPIQYNKHNKKVLKAFYRTELREGEEIIDNQSPTIAKELNVNVYTVDHIIATEMKRKIKAINDRVNMVKEIDIKEIEVEYTEIKPTKPFAHNKNNRKRQFTKEPTFYFNP